MCFTVIDMSGKHLIEVFVLPSSETATLLSAGNQHGECTHTVPQKWVHFNVKQCISVFFYNKAQEIMYFQMTLWGSSSKRAVWLTFFFCQAYNVKLFSLVWFSIQSWSGSMYPDVMISSSRWRWKAVPIREDRQGLQACEHCHGSNRIVFLRPIGTARSFVKIRG